jgi:hypothetical protein
VNEEVILAIYKLGIDHAGFVEDSNELQLVARLVIGEFSPDNLSGSTAFSVANKVAAMMRQHAETERHRLRLIDEKTALISELEDLRERPNMDELATLTANHQQIMVVLTDERDRFIRRAGELGKENGELRTTVDRMAADTVDVLNERNRYRAEAEQYRAEAEQRAAELTALELSDLKNRDAIRGLVMDALRAGDPSYEEPLLVTMVEDLADKYRSEMARVNVISDELIKGARELQKAREERQKLAGKLDEIRAGLQAAKECAETPPRMFDTFGQKADERRQQQRIQEAKIEGYKLALGLLEPLLDPPLTVPE